jgi:hypothetical protein
MEGEEGERWDQEGGRRSGDREGGAGIGKEEGKGRRRRKR